MLPRKRGQFFYLNRAAKQLKRVIFGHGVDKDRRRYAYIRMLKTCPLSKDNHFARQDPELRAKVEEMMGWDKVQCTWNGYDEWLDRRHKELDQQWIDRCKARGYDPDLEDAR